MKSEDMTSKKKTILPNNTVAKYSRKFNKAVVMTDRKKAVSNGYVKHKGKDNE